MKKRCFVILIFVCLLIGIMLFKYKISGNNLVGVYVDNIESSLLPDKGNYVIDKVVCDNEAVGTWDNANWNLLITNLSKKSNCKLYFRSKKEITVTYDNNFVKNNIFEDTYNTLSIVKNPDNVSNTNYKITKENDYYLYNFNSSKDINIVDNSVGYYFYSKKRLLEGKIYSFQFFVKGNTSYNAFIGSEQEIISGYINMKVNVTNNWQRITRKFTTTNYNQYAFVFYGWASKEEDRILEVKNIALQEGEYDNYSIVSFKEYDTLSNTLPTPTRDNYTFLGWYTEPIDGDKVDNNTVVSKDTTYYAHWQYNE